MPKRRKKIPPHTWHGLLKRRSTFDTDVNKLMGQLLEDGYKVTTKLVCDEIGLNYALVSERSKLVHAIANERKRLQKAWKIFETGPTYEQRYKEYSRDFITFDQWKKGNSDLYNNLIRDYGLIEEQIHDIWVSERMFNAFVETGKENNFYFFVTEYDKESRSWIYTLPSFWKYTQYNLNLARKYTKSIKTLLIRHQTMKMLLTSGERVDIAYQLQDDVEKMLTDGRPNRFRCEECMEHGILKEFKEQKHLVGHYIRYHTDETEGDEGDEDDYAWAKYTPEQEEILKDMKNDKVED